MCRGVLQQQVETTFGLVNEIWRIETNFIQLFQQRRFIFHIWMNILFVNQCTLQFLVFSFKFAFGACHVTSVEIQMGLNLFIVYSKPNGH